MRKDESVTTTKEKIRAGQTLVASCTEHRDW